MDLYNETLELIQNKQSILITGGAGVGKSYTLRKIVEWMEEENWNVARTAMTGMASLQLPIGETLHRCIGLGYNKNINDLKNVVSTYKFRTEKRYEIEALDAIIIDEVSMLRSDTIDLLSEVLKYVMDNELPFGGKQIIFSGDFMQLPPVVRPEEKKELSKFWAFQSDSWNALNPNIIYLTEIKRQDDPKFAMALNMIRAGAINDAVDEYFFNTYKNKFPEDIEPVRLLSTNIEVKGVNKMHLNKVKGELIEREADIDAVSDKLRDQIIRDCPAEQFLELKEGAQVMILVNSSNYEFVNGTMAEFLEETEVEIMQFNDWVKVKAVTVRIIESDIIVTIPICEWKIEKKNEKTDSVTKLASFKQYPIKLGWAITIHKSQGMSIDYLQVDLNRCFAEGMAYVALSRARNYEGLKVIN